MGGRGRHDQFSAQLLHRPGRGRRRGHLSQDRIPRAAGPFRLLRLFRAAGRVRHAARGVPGPLPGLARAAGCGTRDIREFRGAWLGAHRLTSCPPDPGAGRQSHHRVRAGLSREPARRQVRPAWFADPQQAGCAADLAQVPGPRRCGRGLRRVARLLGSAAQQVPSRYARPAHRPHGEHLERLPVHDHVQHVAVSIVLRIWHRPRHGLPRFQPGPVGLRPHDSCPGARTHPGPGRDPAPHRRCVPPIPAAHQARERRGGLELQR